MPDHSGKGLAYAGSIGTCLGQLNYVASCGSSTTEGASDVSLSHLFHLPSSTCRMSFVCCVLVGGWVVLFVLFVSRVLQVLGVSFRSLIENAR